MLKPHDAFDREDQEKINVLNDFISSMHESHSNAMQTVIMDETSKSNNSRLALTNIMQGLIKLSLFTLALIGTAIIVKCLIETKCCGWISKQWESQRARRQRPEGFRSRAQPMDSSLEAGARQPLAEPALLAEPASASRPKWDTTTKAWILSEKQKTAV